MNFGQADSYTHVALRPNSVIMVHAVNFRPNAMMVMFDPKPIHVVFVVDKADMFCAENFYVNVIQTFTKRKSIR